MWKRNKGNWKKHTKSMIWSVMIAGIIWISLMSIENRLNTPFDDVKIVIVENQDMRNLVSEKMIRKKLTDLLGIPDLKNINVGKLDISWIEEQLESDSRIENAEVYLDGRNQLNIEINLRKPIVRIMSELGDDYYMDEKGNHIELVDFTAVRVPIATGYIAKYKENWKEDKGHSLQDIFKVAFMIYNDQFLYALVEQIDMNSDGLITIIPKIGRERIFVGTSEDLEFKMENLKLSYKYILRRKGWGKYKRLNLDFPNQVVLS